MIKELDELKLVARVAEALNVTQPAVSKQIAELENIVGVPIVSRDRNRLYLTPIGMRLADHARRVLNQLDRAVFDIDAMASGVSGSVAVGAVSSVAPIVLPGTIALFKSGAPDAEVSLYEGHFVSLFPQLEAGTIDLLIARVWQANELPGVEQMVLLREPIVVVAGPDHPLARHPSVDWPDATDWPWILPQANSIARRAMDALFAEHGLLTPTNTIASLSLSVNLEILRLMPALGLFPLSVARAHSARGEVVILSLDTQGFLSEAHCYWRRDQTEANSSLRLFLKCLKQTSEQRNTIPFG